MKIKEKIVELLENNRDKFFSGNEMAELLGVSRTAVWKAVKKLEDEGYLIEAVNNKGYRIKESTDILSESGMKKYLKYGAEKWNLYVYDEVTSTNTVLREMAGSGAKEGTVVAAIKQTAGKGRLGRSFFSPKDTGLYFSILIRPEFSLEKIKYITITAALAVCRAIEKVSEFEVEIKWVNDVILNQRKICGIGTEAVFSAELGTLDFIVLGVGINIYTPDAGFPEDISGKAGFIFDKPQNDIRNKLLAEFLIAFDEYYENLGSRNAIEEYRRRCCILGRDILVCRGEKRIPAFAVDLDEDCRLKVRYEDGTEECLNSGEVSVKFDNYI